MSPTETEQAALRAVVARRFEQSMRVPETFFAAEAGPISTACLAMARRFHRGGRLLAFGSGAAATDAQHVAVEFVHPVIVGKRALPALALTNDTATLSGAALHFGATSPFVRQLAVLAHPHDMAMGFTVDGNDASVCEGLRAARELGVLTIGMAGGDGGALATCTLDHLFVIPSRDPMVVQETQETLYHVLWELVHIFFEHEGLLT